VKLYQPINIPDKITVDGGVKCTAVRLVLKQTNQGKITGAMVEADIITTVDIEGVIFDFKSGISHTLTDNEMELLMKKYKQ